MAPPTKPFSLSATAPHTPAPRSGGPQNSLPPWYYKRDASALADKKIGEFYKNVPDDEFSSESPIKRARRGSAGFRSSDHQGPDALGRVEILVGSKVEDEEEKEDLEIPVYAYLTASSSVLFRWGKEEAKASNFKLEQAPKFKQIEFFLTFQKVDEKSTRKAIKEAIEKKTAEQAIHNGPRASKGEDEGDSIAVKTLPILRPSSSMLSGSNLPHGGLSLGDRLLQAYNNHEASKTALAATISECVELATDYQSTISKLQGDVTQRDKIIGEYIGTIAEKDAAIMKLQNDRLEKTSHTQDNELIINNQIFRRMMSGPNEGLFVTRRYSQVTVGDIDYQEITALSEFKNVNFGGEQKEPVVQDGITFKRISGGDHDGKLVQDLGPHSVFEHEGKCYVRWYIRTKQESSL